MSKVIKQTRKLQEYQLPLTIKPLEEGGFLARCEKLPGCMAEGETVNEAVANAMDVAVNLIDLYHEQDVPINLKLIKESSPSRPLHFSISLPYQLA